MDVSIRLIVVIISECILILTAYTLNIYDSIGQLFVKHTHVHTRLMITFLTFTFSLNTSFREGKSAFLCPGTVPGMEYVLNTYKIENDYCAKQNMVRAI